MKKNNLIYCGKFKNLFKGWCGISFLTMFGKNKEVYMCPSCLQKNIIRITNKLKEHKIDLEDGE